MTEQEKFFAKILKEKGVDVDSAPPESRVLEITMPKVFWEIIDYLPEEINKATIFTTMLLSAIENNTQIQVSMMASMLRKHNETKIPLAEIFHHALMGGLPLSSVLKSIERRLKGGDKN